MRSYIVTLIKRADKLNQQRTERALGLMSMQGQRVFHAIPVLLHYNHPQLPGYIDECVPHGIHCFQLNDVQTEFVNDLHLTSASPLATPSSLDILAMYTMGSTSSIGQSTSSDLDIWVCVAHTMPSEQRQNLLNKCSMITEWAKSLGVEAEVRCKSLTNSVCTSFNWKQ